MKCVPQLQSWCLFPRTEKTAKFTKAHEFLQRNPSVIREIEKRERLSRAKKFSYRVTVHLQDPLVLLDTLQTWDLLDVLDMKSVDNAFEIAFRTAVSAHVSTRIPGFHVTPIDEIPKNDRVPLVYIQGIPEGTSDEEIRNFFKTISPVLKIKFLTRGRISVYILKLASIRKALRISETADRESFKGHILTVSHQFKSTVTTCFFLTGTTPGLLSVDVVQPEVSQIGDIDRIFRNDIGSLKEIYVSMKSLSDARLACGIMNRRLFSGETVNACFVSPSYFEELYSENNR